MSFQFEITDLISQPTLSMRFVTSVKELPQELGKAYGTLMQYATKTGAMVTGVPYAAYFNNDIERLRVEAGIMVIRRVNGSGDIIPGDLPSGRGVSVVYTGPYSMIESAYTALEEWVKQKDIHVTGTSYEFYLNDPQKTHPRELQTKIVFPLK